MKEKQEINELFEAMVDYFTKVEKKTMHNVIRGLSPKSKLFEEAAGYLQEKGAAEEDIKVLLKQFDHYAFGYHILDSLINDDEISDIKVLGYDKIRVKRNGKRMDSGISFRSIEDVNRFVENVAIKNKVNSFHISLWEHAFVNVASPIYQKMREHCGDYEVWKGLIPDFADPEARKIFADHHRFYLVEQGIDGFKLDECDNSDFVHDWSYPNCTEFPSGMDGEQHHQLFGILYMQAILEALGDQPTLSEVRNAGALAASYGKQF